MVVGTVGKQVAQLVNRWWREARLPPDDWKVSAHYLNSWGNSTTEGFRHTTDGRLRRPYIFKKVPLAIRGVGGRETPLTKGCRGTRANLMPNRGAFGAAR